MLFRAGCLIFTSTVIGYLSAPHSYFKELLSLLKSSNEGDFNENVTKLQQNFVAVLSRKNSVSSVARTPN